MTPLEVNKRIGKMRYDHAKSVVYKIDFKGVKSELQKNYVICYNDDWLKLPQLGESKNWAEDISDAWELFEEMPIPEILKIDSNYYEACFHNPKDETKIERFNAYQAPMAICLAWLAWKEAK